MTSIISLAAAEGGLLDTAKSVGETFGFSSWAFIAQVLSFSLVCAALYKFAYHPFLKVLEDRRQRIELSQKEIAAVKVQVADAERRAADIVTQASAGAHKMVEEARVAAQEFQEKQVQQAKDEAAQIIARAHEAARRDYERMLAELRSEVARLVVETTAKVSGRVLTADDQNRLADEAAKELAA